MCQAAVVMFWQFWKFKKVSSCHQCHHCHVLNLSSEKGNVLNLEKPEVCYPSWGSLCLFRNLKWSFGCLKSRSWIRTGRELSQARRLLNQSQHIICFLLHQSASSESLCRPKSTNVPSDMCSDLASFLTTNHKKLPLFADICIGTGEKKTLIYVVLSCLHSVAC